MRVLWKYVDNPPWIYHCLNPFICRCHCCNQALGCVPVPGCHTIPLHCLCKVWSLKKSVPAVCLWDSQPTHSRKTWTPVINLQKKKETTSHTRVYYCSSLCTWNIVILTINTWEIHIANSCIVREIRVNLMT